MKKKVVCIGQALVDCITRGKEPWRERVYRAQSISLNTGGDALNEASYIRRRWSAGSTYRTYPVFPSWRRRSRI